jgi:hypothetical protein
MYKQSFNALTLSAAGLLSIGLTASLPAAAKCGCPDDGHGAPAPPPPSTTASPRSSTSVTGLGEAFPRAADLAPHPAWQVYAFERDGIRYVQINDAKGTVRAAVGRIDDTFWVMPIGTDADRVSVSGSAGLERQQSIVLLRSADLEVRLTLYAGQAYWRIGTPSKASETSR